jgi:hypothetical protein
VPRLSPALDHLQNFLSMALPQNFANVFEEWLVIGLAVLQSHVDDCGEGIDQCFTFFQWQLPSPGLATSDYLDWLFYDTRVLSAESLDMLVRVMRAERVLFGSDYPFDVGDSEGRVATSAISCFSPDVQSKILTQNAKALLSSK